MNLHNDELVFDSAGIAVHVLLLVQIQMQYHWMMYIWSQDRRTDQPPVVFDKTLFSIVLSLGDSVGQFEKKAFWIVLRKYNRNRISIRS